ncbi:hypothetical protein F5B22DRAFT_502769 [Xylaria bambusicola]|uniref:uncharacterized protein n=1 Tax=Xylaria bambusicola TaxID=326684 RepID=UPI002008818E|nr:uncharacterized protein F5B22DRAFT_502769 [Xylaria bambusicola]KAI0521797.1 hypothetical protein F5B22DRAFT_502769 [Xylaria bambusicola]
MDQIIIPPRNNGRNSYRYTYDDEGGIRNVERMSSIQELTEYTTSRSGLASRSTKSTLMWPFHHRGTSEAASTTRSSRLGRLRSSTWNSRSILRSLDDTASIDQSLVPDYVINFMRGETPESLARKKEARQWGERQVTITPPRRDTLTSHLVELSNHFTSSGGGLSGSSHGSDLRRHFTGWRGGIVYNTLLAIIILIVGIISLILVITRTKEFSGQLAIFSGNCSTATRINIGVHVVINVFTVVLLAGANYVFQILTSPTRREVAEAHDRKQWLDIGMCSLRNFLHVSGFRAGLAAVIIVVAIALQVIYNAVIFFTQTSQDECAVNVSSAMLVIVALLNIILVVTMAVILARSSFEPLATLGDAIRSFLRVPDPMTTNASLLTKADLHQGHWDEDVTKQYTPRSHFWLEAPSLTRWILTILSWLLVAGPTAVAIALMARASSGGITTPFGTTTPETTFAFPAPVEITQLAFVTALPQLLLSTLYLSTNALLTTFFLSHELSLFALGPRSLRVSSNPQGTQTASLYLSLPRPVSWFLLATFAALGFVLSQAVFPIVTSTSSSATLAPNVAFNTQALLILIVLLAVVLFSILALGFRRTPLVDNDARNGNPLVLTGGVCSALISARCQASRQGEFWLGPVTWGVVEEATATQLGRCALTDNAISPLDPRREYA